MFVVAVSHLFSNSFYPILYFLILCIFLQVIGKTSNMGNRRQREGRKKKRGVGRPRATTKVTASTQRRNCSRNQRIVMDSRNCALKEVPAEFMKRLSGQLSEYKFREDLDLPGDEAIDFSGERAVVQTMQEVARTLVGNSSVQVIDGEGPNNLYPSAVKMYKSAKTCAHSDYDTRECKTHQAVFTMYIVMAASHKINFNIHFGRKGWDEFKLARGNALYFPAHLFHEVVQPKGATRTSFVYHFTTKKLSRYVPATRTPRKLQKLRRLHRPNYMI